MTVQRRPARDFAVGLARAFGGALFFSLPLLMTMEMWWLGFYMDRARLAVFLALFVPALVGLCHYAGFEETDTWWDDVRDAFVALFVGFVTAGLMLGLTGVLEAGVPLRETVGQIAIEAIPASIGAALAEALFGDDQPKSERKKRGTGYGGELFLMAAGAIFFAFNIAPTEEMILLAAKATGWRVVAAVLFSLLLMHAFVYAIEFSGRHTPPEGTQPWSVFLRFTVVGYAIVLVMSAYVLWTFGRLDHSSLEFQVAASQIVSDGLLVFRQRRGTRVVVIPKRIGFRDHRVLKRPQVAPAQAVDHVVLHRRVQPFERGHAGAPTGLGAALSGQSLG
jgi:putative integral membrane protein (TIGR02587 family)